LSYGGRPTGVTIVGVLALLAIAAYLIVVWLALTVIANLSNPDMRHVLVDNGGQFLADKAAAIFTILSVVYLAYAIVYAFIGLGFLAGYAWAWKVAVGWGVYLIVSNVPLFVLAPNLISRRASLCRPASRS
jgi:hypothetical protein